MRQRPSSSLPPFLLSTLRARLAHNEGYLSQSLSTRTESSRLSYGTAMSREWLEGEEAAIIAENEWIRATLEEVEGKR